MNERTPVCVFNLNAAKLRRICPALPAHDIIVALLLFIWLRARMRILYVLTSLGLGGAERHTLTLAERMIEHGHDVQFIILRRLPEAWPAALAVEHLNLSKSPLSTVRALLQARRCLRAFRPHIVHSHGFHGNLFARLLRCIAPMPLLIATIHNIYEGGRARMFAYRLTRCLSTRTTAVSEAVASRFVMLRAISARSCVVIRNAIEVREFTPDAQRRASARESMNPGDDFIWLAAGRIAPAKDYPNLLEAFARVHKFLPQTQLWIAGEDRENHLPFLRALACILGIEHAVRWLGLRRNLPALLDAADAFVSSSAWEGMPLAVAEAMAMAKPLVATDVGGVRELVNNTGVLVPPKNSEALAAAMIALMRKPASMREAAGHAARARIQKQFNMETRAAEWEELYQTLLAQRS
jgi:glycosyltransferase involved in cell wall biosynthesis